MFEEKNIPRLQKFVKLPLFGNFNEHVPIIVIVLMKIDKISRNLAGMRILRWILQKRKIIKKDLKIYVSTTRWCKIILENIYSALKLVTHELYMSLVSRWSSA